MSSTSQIGPIPTKQDFFRYVPENDIEGSILGWTTSIRGAKKINMLGYLKGGGGLKIWCFVIHTTGPSYIVHEVFPRHFKHTHMGGGYLGTMIRGQKQNFSQQNFLWVRSIASFVTATRNRLKSGFFSLSSIKSPQAVFRVTVGWRHLSGRR